jgi:hypothetical protein
MPVYREFKAHILVDEQALPEYLPVVEVGLDGVMTASCWVPSEAGKVRPMFFSRGHFLMV